MKSLTERIKLWPVKVARRDERFLSISQIDSFTMSLSEFCLKNMLIVLFTGRNTHT